jgi:hypothetical protein
LASNVGVAGPTNDKAILEQGEAAKGVLDDVVVFTALSFQAGSALLA